MAINDIKIFGGSASPKLTKAICDYLGVSPGLGEVLRFPEGNLFVRIQENVRGRNVYLVQSTAFPANDNFMELLFWIDVGWTTNTIGFSSKLSGLLNHYCRQAA